MPGEFENRIHRTLDDNMNPAFAPGDKDEAAYTPRSGKLFIRREVDEGLNAPNLHYGAFNPKYLYQYLRLDYLFCGPEDYALTWEDKLVNQMKREGFHDTLDWPRIELFVYQFDGRGGYIYQFLLCKLRNLLDAMMMAQRKEEEVRYYRKLNADVSANRRTSL